MLVNSQFHKTLITDLQVFSENHSQMYHLLVEQSELGITSVHIPLIIPHPDMYLREEEVLKHWTVTFSRLVKKGCSNKPLVRKCRGTWGLLDGWQLDLFIKPLSPGPPTKPGPPTEKKIAVQVRGLTNITVIDNTAQDLRCAGCSEFVFVLDKLMMMWHSGLGQ